MLLIVSKWWCIYKGVALILSAIALIALAIIFAVYPVINLPPYLSSMYITIFIICAIISIVGSILSFYIAHQINNFFAYGLNQLACGILCLILVDIIPGILILIDYSRDNGYI